MRLLDAHSRLEKLGQPAFLTMDAAACLGISNSHANKVLTRLAASGHAIRISRGHWMLGDDLNILTLPAHLTAPLPSYVSLQTALYYHGMIDQIPSVTYAVSLHKTKRFDTPLGVISIHHVQPSLFFGFEIQERTGIRLASAEKALIDLLYLSPAKSGLFRKLPELEFPRNFRVNEARTIIERIDSDRRRLLVSNLFGRMIKGGRKRAFR